MSAPSPRRTKEELLLLAVAVAAAGAAFVSLRQAAPANPALWLASATALALALTGGFAYWFGGAVRRRLAQALHGEWDASRSVLAAIPDGLLLVRDGRISSVNAALCEVLGFDREELLGSAAPFPFWPPEHRHEIEAWHATVEADVTAVGELTFARRQGDRIRVLVAGRVVDNGPDAGRRLFTVRDVSGSHRRESRLTELSARDPETGLLDRREFEARLGHAVRRATRAGGNVTVVLAELSVGGPSRDGIPTRPEALVAVDRLARLVRAGDDLARTGLSELGWILPDTDGDGGVEAVARWCAAIEDVDGVRLTAGVCDLSSAGDPLALYALAGQALATARRSGEGAVGLHRKPPAVDRRAAHIL